MAHPIVHLDFAAHDPAISSKFYADVFGWKITKDENFNYYMFSAEGGPGGGFVQIGGDYKQGEIIPYLGTQDIDADLKRVEKAGGKVLQPKMDIGDFGEFAMFADPTGNRVGLYASKTPQG